jgi:Thioesterase-like superfamily
MDGAGVVDAPVPADPASVTRAFVGDEAAEAERFRGGDVAGFAWTGMELRFVEGDFFSAGPAAAWFRFARPLIDDVPVTPVETAVAAADFTNGYAHEISWERWMFANVDLTVHLWRAPSGEWVGARGVTAHGPHGAATSRATLFDADGPIGLAAQSLFVAER